VTHRGIAHAVLSARRPSRPQPHRASALGLVIGDVDMVRPLGLAGIDCAFFGKPDATARFSRHVRAVIPSIEGWQRDPGREDELVRALIRFAAAQPEPPVLYPETDAALLVVSRHRGALGRAIRLSLADAELIEQLADKGLFQALAERLDLPVPPTQHVYARGGEDPPEVGVPFPVIVKPVLRDSDWFALDEHGLGKALRISGPEEWSAHWRAMASVDAEVVVQQLIAGPESAIESYHAYVDDTGAIAGEFTGRKIRTYPPEYGYSTSVEITSRPDVAHTGREILRKLELRGVAKVDFKRDDAGVLHLLEINPRFNLWHHPGALAGVNLPALVHADLTGTPRPPVRREAREVVWCLPLTDLRGAYETGMSPIAWLRWARRCKAVSGLALDDPLPFIRGTLWQATSRRLWARRVTPPPRAVNC
jgi:predicted ATP-grasp superfamily ATP-dependent carboligase